MKKKFLTALQLQKMTTSAKVAKAETVANSMNGNPHYPNAGEKIVQLRGSASRVHDTYNEVQESKSVYLANLALLHSQELELENELTSMGHYVEYESKGDEAKIKSAGFNLRADAAPLGMPDRPESLTAEPGKKEGILVLKWKPVKGARSYVVRQTLTIEEAESWKQVALVTRAGLSLEGLTIGTTYWFEVAAIGAAGQGPWSDPAMKIVR